MQWRTIVQDRKARWSIAAAIAVVILLLIALAAFPWGALRGTIQQRASEQIGRPVTIGVIERLDRFSFTPTIAIHDVRVPQARWAGTGDLARIGTAQVRFSSWALLLGRFKPLGVEIDGLRLNLARDINRRKNWEKEGDTSGDSGASPLDRLILRDAHVTYRDALRQRSFDLRVASDDAGFRIAGSGMVRGSPVKVSAHGPAVAGNAHKSWPFRATIDGPALTMAITGSMAAPLDTRHLTLDMTARASDLKQVDSIVEAGLFGTQPVVLGGHAERDGSTWSVSGVSGTIGQTRISGRVTVRNVDGRTKLDGAVVADGLRFDDFSSDTGLAEAVALRAEDGPKIVPNLRVNLARIDQTDGTIDVTVRHIADPGTGSAFTSMHGRLSMDHQLLIADPLVFELKKGQLVGTVRIDQRGGKRVPTVSLDLALRNSSVGVVAGSGGGQVDGRFDARARLIGPGSTIREAVGNADGTIGAVARNGTIPARIAAMIGFDAGRALLAGSDEQAGLRCVVTQVQLHHGLGRVDPFLIDTTRSQSTGTGTVSFPTESIALHLVGRPKGRILLRLPGAVDVRGTIKQPDIMIPPDLKSVGNIFKAIGRLLRGDQGPEASDADCEALAERALR